MRSRHLVKTLVILVAAALALPFVAAAQTQTSGWTVPAHTVGRSRYPGTLAGERHAGHALRTAGVHGDAGHVERRGVRRAPADTREAGESRRRSLRAAGAADWHRRSITLECRRARQPATSGVARRRSAERTHSGDDRGRQETHRARPQHLLLRFSRCRGRTPVREVRRSRSLRSLVIETTNFNGKVGITRNGNTLLTSPDLKLVERITRVDADTLQYKPR